MMDLKPAFVDGIPQVQAEHHCPRATDVAIEVWRGEWRLVGRKEDHWIAFCPFCGERLPAVDPDAPKHPGAYDRGVKDERDRVLRLLATLTAGGFSEGHDAQRTLKALEEDVRGH